MCTRACCSRRNRLRCSVATSRMMTSISWLGPETRRQRFTKSSSEQHYHQVGGNSVLCYSGRATQTSLGRALSRAFWRDLWHVFCLLDSAYCRPPAWYSCDSSIHPMSYILYCNRVQNILSFVKKCTLAVHFTHREMLMTVDLAVQGVICTCVTFTLFNSITKGGFVRCCWHCTNNVA